MYSSKTYPSQVYRNFKAVNAAEHRKVVHFYERNENDILTSDFDEYFDMAFAYTIALFEIGEYRKHLLMADMVIETSFEENISHIAGQDILQTLLFKKASAHFNLYEHDKAIHLLQELVKINPHDPINNRFLERCLRDNNPKPVRKTRAAAIALFLSAAIFIFTEVLVVRMFYPDYAPALAMVRNLCFVLGGVILVGGEVFHRWRAHREVQDLVQQVLTKKKKRV
jgi:tetratricopeptide (TPR) repeat protein